MKRITEKRERSLGVKLFVKAERCNSPKCVTVRRPQRPGQHGQRRTTVSEYSRQLHEKQKIQAYYGLNNTQMRKLFQSAAGNVIVALEHRLDQVVFRLGLAASPRIARQFISHGHIAVNSRKMTISSYRVKIGDTVSIRLESRGLKTFEDIHVRLKQYEPPSWLELNREALQGKCRAPVTSTDAQFPFDASLVGQFYSR